VALSGAGNRIAIFELSKPGRVDVGGEIGAVQNVAGVMDFTFDPFDSKRLVVACDDASIKVWDIPDNLSGTLQEPSFVLQGHYEKSNVIKYHPLAQHILASAGYDCKIFIWNVQTQSIVVTLESLPEPVFCLSWSPDGKSLGSVGKDHIIRLYKPLESTSPIATGKGPSGSRGARMVWLDDTSFAISGFEKSSDRQLSLYTLPDISNPVSSITLSSSPAILIPHYDPDIKLFYLTGKGDTSVLTVEYCPDVHPHLFSTASFPIGTSHQAIKFLPKTLCNVKTVEVARGVRLCKSTIEPLGFKIPRVKMEYFQDDLYCDTSVTWEPVMSPDEWLGGVTKKQKTISLRPEGMKLLSEMPVQAPSSSAKKYSSHVLHEKTDEEKKEELITAMMSKMNDKDSEPLPQDDMDGVDSDEWDDY
jgi:coronin-7